MPKYRLLQVISCDYAGWICARYKSLLLLLLVLCNKFWVNCLPSEYFFATKYITPYRVRQKKSKSGTHVTVWLLFWLHLFILRK